MDLLAGSDRVRETITWKLTQFALGRPLGAADAADGAADPSSGHRAGRNVSGLDHRHRDERPRAEDTNAEITSSKRSRIDRSLIYCILAQHQRRNTMPHTPISRRTMLKSLGTATIGLPLLEEMLSIHRARGRQAGDSRAGVQRLLRSGHSRSAANRRLRRRAGTARSRLSKKLLIMRNVDQVRCDEKGINAHYDGASGAFTAEPPDGEAKSGGPSIDQVIRKTHYPQGMPAGHGADVDRRDVLPPQPRRPIRAQLQPGRHRGRHDAGEASRSVRTRVRRRRCRQRRSRVSGSAAACWIPSSKTTDSTPVPIPRWAAPPKPAWPITSIASASSNSGPSR